MLEMCDSFSVDPLEKFCIVDSFFSTPEKTLKYEILPANASEIVTTRRLLQSMNGYRASDSSRNGDAQAA